MTAPVIRVLTALTCLIYLAAPMRAATITSSLDSSEGCTQPTIGVEPNTYFWITSDQGSSQPCENRRVVNRHIHSGLTVLRWSLDDEAATLTEEPPSLDEPGGYPVLPPVEFAPTITAPTFTIADSQASAPGVQMDINTNQFSISNQEKFGVVPEPSTGMLGAISLALLWRRCAP